MFYGVASNTLSGSTFGVSNGMANPALSFATVTDIRDTNIRVQPQVLLNNMNGWGLVDKNKALYPFVSDGYIESRATQHKYNLINPADTDAAFRITFSGGLTHSATGVLPNGSTGYGDTHLNDNTVMSLNDAGLSFYSGTNALSGGYNIGCFSGNYFCMAIRNVLGNARLLVHDAAGLFDIAVANSTGMFTQSRTNSANKQMYRNGASIANYADVSTAKSNLNIYLFALNNIGVATSYTTHESRLAAIHNGMDVTQAANFASIINTFQTALGRNTY